MPNIDLRTFDIATLEARIGALHDETTSQLVMTIAGETVHA